MSERQERMRWWSGGLDVLLVVVIIGLMGLQVLTSIGAYLFGGVPRPQEIAQYWVVAGGTLALSLAGFTIAVLRRRIAPAVCFALFFLALIFVALVLSVPRIELPREAPSTNDNYVPCYSGSNDCPGG